MTDTIADSVRLDRGPVDLTAIETDAAPGFAGKKADGQSALADMATELADLQERLWAERTAGSERRVLLVLQGMDTSGKGGVLRHAVGLIDPQGVRITSFKAPTEEEKAHDFLWRIEKGLPSAGYVGVFDRSHYEDVLIARVRGFAEPDEIERRYGAINDFEARLVAEGTTVIKCMLHISADEQKARLQERLDNPEKFYKFNPGDLDERALWPAYREAYEIALERTNTEAAPWHVIPADKKWFRNLAVAQLLLDALRGLDLQWPAADFDVEAEKRRLAEETPVR
ncbi:PPK2 family polyphosphate kinase [Nocardioides currus]|uniref:Phosphate--nucleotide phosphotransferase n=1 Tax=Nocardioides currus TaxID=2133958 RepID=A0A2R7YTJ3_9ACTN|nr:PPK2 family polyphosphate kinase [Nocardioides currus]PUA79159.1 phosphate--nucleotide phosphotransferase [Nocardioides currus]